MKNFMRFVMVCMLIVAMTVSMAACGAAEPAATTEAIPETTEAAAAGAARLAAMAAGDPLPALEFSKVYKPTELAADYEAKYRKFRTVEKRLWALEVTE